MDGLKISITAVGDPSYLFSVNLEESHNIEISGTRISLLSFISIS